MQQGGRTSGKGYSGVTERWQCSTNSSSRLLSPAAPGCLRVQWYQRGASPSLRRGGGNRGRDLPGWDWEKREGRVRSGCKVNQILGKKTSNETRKQINKTQQQQWNPNFLQGHFLEKPLSPLHLYLISSGSLSHLEVTSLLEVFLFVSSSWGTH